MIYICIYIYIYIHIYIYSFILGGQVGQNSLQGKILKNARKAGRRTPGRGQAGSK